ncbi:Dyp-type peroxidase [Methylibium sp.]|uniref:Dyp-type peroxidase n=1 Tax=Methylibium sp. TaxID=2067992 RepID=UPI003D0F2FDC
MTAPASAAPVDLDDVQGLVRFGYKHHTQACFVLLRITDRDAARAWLASAPVTSARNAEPVPQTALQVALTSQGLRALGVADDIVAGFSAEFIAGMDDAARARRLGDVGASDPSRWRWGAAPGVPHVLLLLYALPGHLPAWQRTVCAQCTAGFEQMACLSTSDMDGVEPFGFVDGISQPRVDWERRRPARDADPPAYTNLACLGEFLLGYPNEYGGYTDRPLLDPQRDALGLLARAEDAPDKADLGRNGSYLVLRQLRQDVAGFWQFLDRQAGSDPLVRQRLAEAMVGRTLQGVPLAEPGGEAFEGETGHPEPAQLNAFTFRADPAGLRCPLGAHIRRSNPRNADLPPGGSGPVARLVRTLGFDAEARARDLVASTRFHRLLRRGREYGSPVSLPQALAGTAAGDETGLHFICLGANLARQFEFVQAAWLMAAKFDGLSDESDPLLGNRQPGPAGTPTDHYSIPQAQGPDQRVSGLPQFVTVLGGAYFFLPGIRALRFLASAR